MIDFKTNRGREESIKQGNAVYVGASLKGKKVFLIDDVVSTGTSLINASKTLLEAGAEQVFPIGVVQSLNLIWEKEQFDRIRREDAVNSSPII